MKQHQELLGHPPEGVIADDPREQLRRELGYFQNNHERMKYDEYRREGLYRRECVDGVGREGNLTTA